MIFHIYNERKHVQNIFYPLVDIGSFDVNELKQYIYSKHKIPVSEQVLYYKNDSDVEYKFRTIEDYAKRILSEKKIYVKKPKNLNKKPIKML